MWFGPDIVVTSPDSPQILVAVETRLRHDNLNEVVDRLKHFLVNMSCPLGLLVLPDEMRIYRNLYTGGDERSVQQVGRYPLQGVFPFESGRPEGQPAARGLEFERAVQRWIEDLAEGKAGKGLSPELRGVLEEHVIPALERGLVRAAHPRETKVPG